MWGGYEGPGSKTVIPSEAHAKITCRLVPNQDPARIVAARRATSRVACAAGRRRCRSTRRSRRARRRHCHRPRRATRGGRRVAGTFYGVPPLIVRMGGTVPIAELFQRHLGRTTTVFFSFSTADEDYHAPNEFFRVHRLHEGLEAWDRACWIVWPPVLKVQRQTGATPVRTRGRARARARRCPAVRRTRD